MLEVFWFRDGSMYTAFVRRGRTKIAATCGRDRADLGRMVREVVELVLGHREPVAWRLLRSGDHRLRATLD